MTTFEEHKKHVQDARKRVGIGEGVLGENIAKMAQEFTMDNVRFETVAAFVEYAKGAGVYLMTGKPAENPKLIKKGHLALLLAAFLEASSGDKFDLSKHTLNEQL